LDGRGNPRVAPGAKLPRTDNRRPPAHPRCLSLRSREVSLPRLIKLSHYRLSAAERAQIIACLVEGNSIRSTARLTGFARNTITTLLVQIGAAASDYQDRTIRNLTSTRIEADEIWAFCYAKAKNVPEPKRGEFGYGDVWTWTAIDPDTKLIASWLVGQRDEVDGLTFLMDLRADWRTASN